MTKINYLIMTKINYLIMTLPNYLINHDIIKPFNHQTI